MPCVNVPDVPNGKRNPTKDSVMCGTEVKYTCNNGFSLEGDRVLECGADGQLQGQVPACRGFGNLFTHLANHLDNIKIYL